MNLKNRKTSIDFFRIPPHNYNCAQSILKGFEFQFQISEMKIHEFREWGGGRAEDGICGALFAAESIFPVQDRSSLRHEFQACAGAINCKELKALDFPCFECVRLADQLVEKRLNK